MDSDLATKIVDKYRKDTAEALNNYLILHEDLLKLREREGNEAYMKARLPVWTIYKETDDAIYKEYVEDCKSV